MVRVVAMDGSDATAMVSAEVWWYDTWYTHKHTALSITEVQRFTGTSTETYDEFVSIQFEGSKGD